MTLLKGESLVWPSVQLKLLRCGGRSPCVTFSQDTSLMAAGFEESYIRIWSLKGESLNGLKSDFNANNIKDSSYTIPLLQTFCRFVAINSSVHPIT